MKNPLIYSLRNIYALSVTGGSSDKLDPALNEFAVYWQKTVVKKTVKIKYNACYVRGDKRGLQSIG